MTMPDTMTEIPKTPENPLQRWVHEVKSQLKNGQAKGAVTARTNFDIAGNPLGRQKADLRADRLEGYTSGLFLRGSASREDGEFLYNFMGSVNSHETGFPRDIDNDVLYISVVKPANLDFSKKNSRTKAIEDSGKKAQSVIGRHNSIIEARYAQPQADSSRRTATKWVYLVVSDEIAEDLVQMVDQGVDPNYIHGAIKEVFTTPETKDYFDANILNRADPSKIDIEAVKPEFKESYLSRTDLMAQFERKTIKPDVLNQINEDIWIERAEPFEVEDDTKPNRPTEVIPSYPGRRTGGAEDPNFRRTNSEESEKIIEGEVIEDDFVSKVKSLMEGDKPELSDEWIQRQARLVLHDFGRTRKELKRILSEGNTKFSNGEIEEGEWAKFAGLVLEEKEKMDSVAKLAPERNRSKKYGPAEVKVVENIPHPEDESVEGWTRFIFAKIDEVEKATEGMRAPEQVDVLWSEVEKSLKTIPSEFGTKFRPTDAFAERYFKNKYPEGFFLKERLQSYFNARKHLHIRYLQIEGAGGNLAAMGLGSEEMKHLNIGIGFQEVYPVDEWTIIHSDEMFASDIKNVTQQEEKELLPNVDKALSKWYEVGSLYNSLPDDLLTDDEKRAKAAIEAFMGDKWPKNGSWSSDSDVLKKLREVGSGITMGEISVYREIPTYLMTLNTGGMVDLEERVVEYLGSRNASMLASRLLTCWLTFPMLDRDRKSTQGKSEDRDLMYSDYKRGSDFGEKGRLVQPEWTVQRYFSRPRQEDSIKEKDIKKDETKTLKDKKLKLAIARERAVFAEPENWHEGELLADFLHTAVPVIESGEQMYRKLIRFAIDRDGKPIIGGWKEIPFLRMGENSYSGYFTYNINIVKAITEAISAPAKLEEMTEPSFWVGKKALFDRLSSISPWLNSNWEARQKGTDQDKIDAYKTNTQEKFRMIYAAGLLWFGSLDAKKGTGGAIATSTFSHQDVLKIYKAIEAAGYLSNESYKNQLRIEIQEMGFGAHWWRHAPGVNWAVKERYRTNK